MYSILYTLGQVIAVFFGGFESHAGIGKYLLWGWKLPRRKEEEEWVSLICRKVSLRSKWHLKGTWKLGSEKTQRDQKNPSKNQLPSVQWHQASISRKQSGWLTLAAWSEGGSRVWGLEWPAGSARKKRNKSQPRGLEELEASFFNLGWRGRVGGRCWRWEGWRMKRAGRELKGFKSWIRGDCGLCLFYSPQSYLCPQWQRKKGCHSSWRLTFSAALYDEEDKGHQQQCQYYPSKKG